MYAEAINFLGKAITVKSSDGRDVTTISAATLEQPVSVVTFASGEGRDSILDGFTITGGSGTEANNFRRDGGIYIDGTFGAGGGISRVRGALALGVRGRLLVTLLAVAFLPLFTMLGVVRSAVVRFEAGVPIGTVVPALATASAITFFVYVVLGLVLALLFARSVTERLGAVAAALRRVQAGDVDVRVEVSSADEMIQYTMRLSQSLRESTAHGGCAAAPRLALPAAGRGPRD